MIIRTSLIGLLLFILSSCSTVKVDVDYDNSAKFRQLSKYAWLEDKATVTGNALIDSNTLLHDRIRTGIEQWLDSRGYLKSKSVNADFLVNYRVTKENISRRKALDFSYGYSFYGYPYSWDYGYYSYYPYYYSPYVGGYYPGNYYSYQRNALVIDIINPENKKLMWRGIAYLKMSFSSSQKNKEKDVQRTIQTILSKFPPDAKKK